MVDDRFDKIASWQNDLAPKNDVAVKDNVFSYPKQTKFREFDNNKITCYKMTL